MYVSSMFIPAWIFEKVNDIQIDWRLTKHYVQIGTYHYLIPAVHFFSISIGIH